MTQDAQDARIAELEAENRRLRRFLDDKGLPAEQRHQMRNTLAMLRAIIRRSAETSDSVESYAAHLDGRLDAISRVLGALLRNLPDGVSLHGLVADELLAHLAREGEQVTIAGPGLQLRSGAAEIVALAIHELAVNAIEHGALTVPHGRIAVTWRVAPAGAGQRLTFVWKEEGLETLPAAPPRRGFGSEVLERSLRYELKAETALAYEPDGLRCTIDLPMMPRMTLVEEEE